MVLGGDFNAILSLSEKLGWLVKLNRSHQEFVDFALMSNLQDLSFFNGDFTWTN